MCSGLPGFLSELEKSEVDRNEMTHYQIINEKATLLQCFWINIQVTFQTDKLFLCSSEQNKAHFQPDVPSALCVKAEEEGINPPGTHAHTHALTYTCVRARAHTHTHTHTHTHSKWVLSVQQLS